MARPKSDIDTRIVRAARERFLREGVDGASLRGIADDAGTSVGMVYYWFPTKDDLFLAVIEDIYGTFLGDIEAAVADGGDTEERIHRAFKRLSRMSDEELTVIRLVLREVLVSSERRSRVAARFLRGHVPLLIATLAEGVSRGDVAPGFHPASLVFACIALAIMPQVAIRLISTVVPKSVPLPTPEVLAEDLVRVLFRGIGARGEGPREA